MASGAAAAAAEPATVARWNMNQAHQDGWQDVAGRVARSARVGPGVPVYLAPCVEPPEEKVDVRGVLGPAAPLPHRNGLVPVVAVDMGEQGGAGGDAPHNRSVKE